MNSCAPVRRCVGFIEVKETVVGLGHRLREGWPTVEGHGAYHF